MPDDLPVDVPLPVCADLISGMIPVADFVEAELVKMSWVDRKPGFRSSTRTSDESNCKHDVEKSASFGSEHLRWVFESDYFD